jgi:hypothetical protein
LGQAGEADHKHRRSESGAKMAPSNGDHGFSFPASC